MRAGLVDDPFEYEWSSIGEYFTGKDSIIVDNHFVENLFGDKKNMMEFLKQWMNKNIPVRTTRFGDILGEEGFVNQIIKKIDRREKKDESIRMRKEEDYIFESAQDVIKRFEEINGIKIDEIDFSNFEGKELRSGLLIMLKDRAGLRYKDIIRYPIFKALKYSSLGQLYKRAKKELNKDED